MAEDVVPNMQKKMAALQSCHRTRINCGSHLDCSDKDSF